jgi:hypothetical protein
MITIPSQHTESHITTAMARPSITVAQLLRWSGLVNILAGILYALETLLHPARDITKLAAITQQSVLGVSWHVSHTLGIAAGSAWAAWVDWVVYPAVRQAGQAGISRSCYGLDRHRDDRRVACA